MGSFQNLNLLLLDASRSPCTLVYTVQVAAATVSEGRLGEWYRTFFCDVEIDSLYTAYISTY